MLRTLKTQPCPGRHGLAMTPEPKDCLKGVIRPIFCGWATRWALMVYPSRLFAFLCITPSTGYLPRQLLQSITMAAFWRCLRRYAVVLVLDKSTDNTGQIVVHDVKIKFHNTPLSKLSFRANEITWSLTSVKFTSVIWLVFWVMGRGMEAVACMCCLWSLCVSRLMWKSWPESTG